VTVSLANGKTEQWVTDRTGHKSSQMLSLYTRQARTWQELGLGTLQPLDELLPEMKPSASATGPPKSRRRRSTLHWATNGPRVAPTAGLEPATRRLTAACSTN
jgi:hypothetical protein